MSDSTSSQAQTSTYTDNRVALGQGAQNANNGGVILTSTTNYTLDQQAVNRALDTVDNTTGSALNTVGSSVASALNFAGDSQAGFLSALSSAIAQAFNFGTDAQATAANSMGSTVTQALNFAGDSQAGALGTVGKALTLAGNAQSDALGTVGDALAKVSSFGTQVLDQTASNENLLASAYSDAKGQGALTQKILIVAVIGALAIAALAVQKKA